MFRWWDLFLGILELESVWDDQKGSDTYNANNLIATGKDEYLEEDDLPFPEENRIQAGTLINSSE